MRSASNAGRDGVNHGLLVQVVLRLRVRRLEVEGDLLQFTSEGVGRLVLVGPLRFGVKLPETSPA